MDNHKYCKLDLVVTRQDLHDEGLKIGRMSGTKSSYAMANGPWFFVQAEGDSGIMIKACCAWLAKARYIQQRYNLYS